MGCLCFHSPETNTKMASQSQHSKPQIQENNHQILLQIPGCRVHLMEEGEALELANGDFTIIRVYDDNVCLATIVKIGEYLQWPVTKDEPVVKLNSDQYLFSLPMNDGDPLSYGVSFSDKSCKTQLDLLDRFLIENCCFLGAKGNDKKKMIDWKEFAPRIDDYNNVLAKAIAGGTGQIVRGIFICSNAYTKQVQKGGEMIQIKTVKRPEIHTRIDNGLDVKKKNLVNKSLKRARDLSKATEKLSKKMLDGVGVVSTTVMKPLMTSRAGKAFFAMVPGEVLLASLDALNKVLDAAEAAEKQTLSATSSAATRMVSNRFGENAGEATGDALAAAGHCVGTAWNVLKIRKAINPATSATSGMLKNASVTKSAIRK